jgi:hypothetical protein
MKKYTLTWIFLISCLCAYANAEIISDEAELARAQAEEMASPGLMGSSAMTRGTDANLRICIQGLSDPNLISNYSVAWKTASMSMSPTKGSKSAGEEHFAPTCFVLPHMESSVCTESLVTLTVSNKATKKAVEVLFYLRGQAALCSNRYFVVRGEAFSQIHSVNNKVQYTIADNANIVLQIPASSIESGQVKWLGAACSQSEQTSSCTAS